MTPTRTVVLGKKRNTIGNVSRTKAHRAKVAIAAAAPAIGPAPHQSEPSMFPRESRE